MTREDAVKELSVEYFGDSEKIREAKKMAIKALSAEPCEDCISRQAVLDGIDNYIEKVQSTGAKDDFISFEELVVKDLPSVQPKPKTDFERKAEIVISQLRADRDRLQDAIDKIRAEIIEACGYSKDYVGTFDYTTTYLKIVLQIIDKYKAESEEIDT